MNYRVEPPLGLKPIDVDALFAEAPGLFVYELPSKSQRNSASVGDLTKLFIQLPEYRRPRPYWYVVTSVHEEADSKRFSAEPWARYPESKRQRLGTIEFDVSHIYRLSTESGERENPVFDADFRDEAQPPG